MTLGLGYASPFLALRGDNFLLWEPHGEEFAAGLSAPASQSPPPDSSPTAWTSPTNVLLWYVLFRLFGTYTAASVAAFYAVQTLTMAATLLLAGRIVAARHGPVAASLTLAAVMLYPSTWYFTLEGTHGTVLFLALLLAGLFALDRLLDGRGTWIAAFALSVAFAVMTEPASLLFYLWLVPWAAMRTGRRLRWPMLAATAACCLVVWGAWGTRNLITMGRFIPFKSNPPMELMYGNNPDALDDPILAHQRRFPSYSESERLRLLEMGETAYADEAFERAATFIRENPLAFVTLTARRISFYWSYQPYRATAWRPFLTLLFHALLALWIASLVRLRGVGLVWLERVGVAFALLFPVAYYVTQFMLYRYRFPVEFLMIATAVPAACRRNSPDTPCSYPSSS
jgi:hypothetical protein